MSIQVDLNEEQGFAVIIPGEIVGLSESDFTHLRIIVDDYLKDHSELRGVVIVVERFPGWDDFDAFISHVRFVRDHHAVIRKVALVSDSFLLSKTPSFMDHFVSAKVRHFPFSDVEQAKQWVVTDVMPSEHIKILEGFPDRVLAIQASGVLNHDDYEQTLNPVIEQKINAHDKISLLYWCGEDFEGFSAGAMWDDARLGVMHLGDFAKVAFVTDVGWLRQSVKLFAPMLRAPVKVFYNADINEAKQWITEDSD